MRASEESSAHNLRRQADLDRLRQLAARSGGRLELLETGGLGGGAGGTGHGQPLRLAIGCRTAGSSSYPQTSQHGVTLRIDLPSRYPFQRPVLTVESPIFHPNIFASGVVCQGDKWLPGEGLDLLVKRIVKLAIFDPGHVNPASAANRAAAAWYLRERSRSPHAFPTDRMECEAAAKPARVVRPCPACGQALRLPAGRQGIVACPACGRDVEVAT